MRLSILIPVWNNWNFTKTALNDLSNLPDDCEVVVVDNGSTDDTKKWMEGSIEINEPKNLIKHREEGNLGFSRASNIAFMKSSGEYSLFLNNDIRVQRDKEKWVDELIGEASDGSLVGPTVGLLDSDFRFVREGSKLDSNYLCYMSGWCLCAKKSVFDRLIPEGNEYAGPFSNDFHSYFEDTDLSFRASKSGINFKVVDVPVFHFGRMTGKKLGLSDMYSKSKTIFLNKWAGKL